MDEITCPSSLALAARALIASLKAWPDGEASDSGLEAFARSYRDLAYIATHIEGNARILQEGPVLAEIRLFLVSEEFRRRASEWIRSLIPKTSRGTALREAWLGWMERELAQKSIKARRQEERLAADFAARLEEASSVERDLLRRLGVAIAPGGYDAAYFAVAGRVANAVTRRKLDRVWTEARTRRVEDLTAALQRLVRARFGHAREAGFETPLARSLGGGLFTPDALREFLQAALAEAAAGLRDLSELASARLGGSVGLAVDLPRLLATTESSESPLLLPVEGCLSFVADIAQRSLGVRVETVGLGFSSASGTTLAVYREESDLGRIHVCTAKQNARLPITTSGPAAWVLCRLSSSGGDVVTLEGARLMFHEFGHALAHVLSNERAPATSGLDGPPVGGIELLSTWFETWAHHPSLEEWLALSEGQRLALARARRVKAIEFTRSQPTRVVCALVDLAAHADPSADVLTLLRAARGAYPEIEALIEREVLGDFAHPFLMSHPGCSFVYPVAYAFACERVLPRLDDPLDALGPDPDLVAIATSGQAQCRLPDPRAPRRFFNRASGSIALLFPS